MTQYLILCGGIGSRLHCSLFPKPLTLVKGIPLINRVLDSLDVDNITFIVNPYLKSYNFEEYVRKYQKKITLTFWYLPYVTRGSLETLYMFLINNTDYTNNIVILDNDNLYYFSNNINNVQDYQQLSIKGNGLLYIKLNNQSNNYSFINYNLNNRVTDISEKCKISDNVCVGYYLTNVSRLIPLMKNILSTHEQTGQQTGQHQEYYISLLYKQLLNRGEVVTSFLLSKAIILGTEFDMNQSLLPNNNKQPIVVYDLDNTLITTSNEPITRHIEFVKYLKSIGWYIIIHTARGMKNNDLTYEKKQSVIEVIEKYNIPYDELIFGKPYADLYIDDKAHNPYDEIFYKKLGFDYKHTQLELSNMNKNNSIFRSTYNTITKQSQNGVMNEVNYYKFVNKNQLDYFPKLIHYQANNIEIEFINGPTFSDLYLEGLLTDIQFTKLLDIMDSLHNSLISDDVILSKYDYVQFYSKKFYERSISYEPMSWYKESIMKTIECWLMNYLTSDIISSNMIHGDLWFPNILLMSNNQIKLIDMRGLVGDKITIKGDKNYDYAKVYQSLIGMDSIIKTGKYNVNQSLIDVFHKRYEGNMKLIKMMTAYTIYCSLFSWNNNHFELMNLVETLIL